ncbi:MAG: hypothetical protein SGI77_11090 [Pirellulaceae bacterium]|nr:hypothetical protein [Pirellulaceae bacterium]
MNDPHALWIDGVGGYAMCDSMTTILGGTMAGDADLRINSDLPSRVAAFHYRGQDHLIEPFVQLAVNERAVTSMSLLTHMDVIRIGNGVELVFQQPTSLSGTGVLRIRSRHRWSGSLDGALLLGHSCLLGPSPTAHVQCKEWSKDVLLFRNQNQWLVRYDKTHSEGEMPSMATHPIKLGERIQGRDFSMTWL